jgi:WD40 repeat protein
MFQVVCQVVVEPKQINFKWSAGAGEFKPYTLVGAPLRDFRHQAQDCRKHLQEIVEDYLAWCKASNNIDKQTGEQSLRKSCWALAQAGYRLYDRLFRPDPDSNLEVAEKIRSWLEGQRDAHQVRSLELVLDGNPSVPWTVLYDQEVSPATEQAFLTGPPEDLARWHPFWGIHYNLAAGPRVDPLRSRSAPPSPTVLMVIHKDVREQLPTQGKHRLEEFIRARGLQQVDDLAGLNKILRQRRPDLIYWLSHATPAGLALGEADPLTPDDLYLLLEDSPIESDGFAGLVFLNACRTAEATANDASFLSTLQQTCFSGAIATEQQTIDHFANELGLDFLEDFLDRGERVGAILQKLRRQVPLGLLYSAYCPPHICRASPPPEIGPAPLVIPPGDSLPEQPYRSFQHFDRGDRALFAGRDADVLSFSQILNEAGTRLMLLHGESGVGKTSFLRAGVIPFLEENSIGFRGLAGGEGPAVPFIRSTQDLAGQLASELMRYCRHPLRRTSPTGEAIEIDLPGIVAPWPDDVALRAALVADHSLLGRLLGELGKRLPFASILVIDQAEEVFTLARTPMDAENRRQTLEMLRLAGEAGDFKIILSLRTEYYGRFVDGLRQGVRPGRSVREYLLTDFDQDRLADAILKPTEFPKKYDFRYADGLAASLGREIVAYCRNKQDSVLPLAQVICTQLYEQIRRRLDREIHKEDVDAIGGIEGGMKRHVENLLRDHLPEEEHQAIRRLLSTLYLRQPDGALTTALIPEKNTAPDEKGLESFWVGHMPLDRVLAVMTQPEVKLLRMSTLRIGGGEERRYVSLGHDALAGVAAAWDEEFSRWARLRMWVAGLAGALLLAAGIAALAFYASEQAATANNNANKLAEKEKEARIQANRARKALHLSYLANMQLAQQFLGEGNVVSGLELLDLQRPLPGQEDMRTFDWYYFWRVYHREVLTLQRPGAVASVAFSADGKMLAFGSRDKTVKVWDVASAQDTATLQGHSGLVYAVAFSPDGKTVASASADKTVKLWDLASGKATVTFKGHSDSVRPVAFSPDGKMLASGSRDKTVKLWDVASGKEITTLAGHTGVIESVAFGAGGKILASGGSDKIVKLWDVASRKEITTLPGHTEPVQSLAFDRGGSTLASGGLDKTVKLWDVASGEERRTLLGHTDSVLCVALSPDGKTLVSGSRDNTVKLWDVASGEERRTLLGHTDSVLSVALSPDGKMLASGSGDKTVKLWDVGYLGEPPRILPGHKNTVASLAFSPDGKTLASGSWDKTIKLWDAAAARATGTFQGHSDRVYSVAFSPDGKTLASGSDDKTIKLWDMASGKERRTLLGHTDSVLSVAFSPDGKTLASGSSDKMVKLWDVTSGKERRTLPGHTDRVTSVAFSPDGKTVASGSWDKTIRLWDVAATKATAIFQGHSDWVYSVVFSPDGKTLASGSLDWTAKLWDVASGRATVTLQHGFVSAHCVGFSPDGKTLALGSDERAVQLWDVASGKATATLQGHFATVYSVAFSLDGKTLASGGDDMVIRLWRAVTPRDILDYCERMAGLNRNSLRRQVDLVLACWALFVHLDLRSKDGQAEAHRVLDLGRTTLLRLKEKTQLAEDQQPWITEFDQAIDRLAR